jgi:hypothetical protein
MFSWSSLAGSAVKAVAGAAAGSVFGGGKDSRDSRGGVSADRGGPDMSKFNLGMMAPREKNDSKPAPVSDMDPAIFDYMKLIQGITKPNG